MKWGKIMKRLISKIVLSLLVITFVFSLASCFNNDSQNSSKNEGITLNKTQLQTLIGDTNLLSVKGESINEENLVWSSSNPEVAKVVDGMVESVRVGTAQITATYGKYSASCSVSVSLGTKLPQLVIENERTEYRIGKSEGVFPFEIYVLYNGKKFYDAQIEYYSSNDSVATFNANGELNVVDIGSASLSFTASWRGMDEQDIPTLFKTVQIEVVEEVYFYVNGLQYEQIELWTVDKFDGKNYINQMDFDLSVDLNGTVSKNVEFVIPEQLLAKEGNSIRAISYGTGTILLKYTDENNNEYQSTIELTVTRPEANYSKEIEYFSSFVGTFKDVENGYADTTLAKALFGSDSVEDFKAFYEDVELETENGKILGMPSDYTGSYDAVIRVESEKLIYNVQLKVYSIVIQNAKDLELFGLKVLKYDDATTFGIDETKITCIDGYCEMIADIDATGIKINHEAFNATFPYVKADGTATSTNITGIWTRYSNSTNNSSTLDEGTAIFGFTGRFNGNGHTIANLDLSVENGKLGGGLFGYILGNGIVENVAFTDMNISNSSGIAYATAIAAPRKMPTDKRGLRTDNTQIHDVYIQLSANTINPKGALLNTTNSLGLLTLNNIIVDATEVSLNGATSGAAFMNNGTALCAQNISTRFYSQNVYFISDEYPAFFGKTVTIYGANETDGTPLDGQTTGSDSWVVKLEGNVYSSKFNRYDSVEDMKDAGLDYSSFTSKSWIMIDGYPIFKTAAGVYAYYNGEYAYDGTIIVASNVNGKKLSLLTPSGEVVVVDEYIYNSNELNVDAEGKVTLANAISAEKEYFITLKYTLNGKADEIKVKVLAYPENYTISKEIKLSALDGRFELSNYVISSKQITAIKQEVAGQTYNLSIDKNGKINGLFVAIKSDYSDVETSMLTITTTDMEYRFDNVKVYSHVIKKAEDLKVFAQKKTSGRITGYYVLGADIDATGLSIGHEESLYIYGSRQFINESYDNIHSFQGVFDGCGYAIYNFQPTATGLFGAIYSDSAENGGKTVVRNVAFMNVQSQTDKPFTILGAITDTAGNGVTELTNVHVEIAETYMSNYNPTLNYKGLIGNNASKSASSFKFTNVYIAVENEDLKYDNKFVESHGSIFSKDAGGINSTSNIVTRSSRFDNVITITKMNPCVYRRLEGDKLSTSFNVTYMYAVYAESDIGGNGMICDWLPEGEKYYHSPIDENAQKASFIYKNVYRYDSVSQVSLDKIEKFTQTGLWKYVDGMLLWASNSYVGTDDNLNFDVDWIGQN